MYSRIVVRFSQRIVNTKPGSVNHKTVPAIFSRFNSSTSSKENETSKVDKNIKFATLFRNSPLVQLGMPEGKIVVGNVVDVVGDDIYIDFGFKFNAVCKRPRQNGVYVACFLSLIILTFMFSCRAYVRGAKVRVRINDLELSDRFLGSQIDMTLLEADVTLLGVVSTPARVEKTESS